MKVFLCSFICLLFWTWSSATQLTAAEPPPNIILIFADDLGWKDVGYQGTDFYETPIIDALAKNGMVFTDAYAAAGNCAPSRACLLSGQYTPRHEVFAVGNTERGPKKEMRVIPIPNKSGLAPKQYTLAEGMKDAGYVTAKFGKWHLGGPDGAKPSDQGFDVVYDNQGAGAANGEGNVKGKATDPKGVFSLTNAACEFMEKNQKKPFFLYLPHHAIHTPLQGQEATQAKFQKKPKGKQHDAAMYAACLYDLDQSVGQLLKKTEELGIEKNTLIIFTSDNGGTQQSSQEPLRGSKGGYYEGGIREPFIAYWPGTIQPETRCTVPVINVDLFPTFLDVAGVKTTDKTILDGESLLPLFRGEKSLKREAIFWHFPGYLDRPVLRPRDKIFRTRPVTVIRKGDWKLHLYHEEWHLDGGKAKIATNNAVELYNLKDDIGERVNLANEETKIRDELVFDVFNWLNKTKAKIPNQPNPNFGK